jgi:uncharacterized membrane protein YfhO
LKNIKKYAFCLFAPLICVSVILFIFGRQGHYPFSNQTIAYLDMYQQYVPLLYSLSAITKDWSNLFYSFDVGGGMNFFGVFCYYLNPDSFLSLFFGRENLIYFVNVLLIIKISLSSLFAAMCFKYCFKNLNRAIAVLLGVSYGFCGYVMQLYQIIGWVSGMVIFPLIIISLYRLINDDKYIMFIICLSAAFFINFYIALFIVGFGIFISAFYIIFIANDKIRAAATLLLSTIAALLISCIILLPCYYSINSSVRESSIFNNVIYGNPYELNSHIWGQIQTKTAYLLCGAITMPSVLILLFDIKRYGKKGVYLLLCSAITLLPVIIEPLNVLWHLGSYACFPLRLGFITCFMQFFISAAVFSETGSFGIGVLKNDYNFKKLLYLIFCLLSVCAFYYFYSLGLKSYKSDIIYSSYLLDIMPDAFEGLAILFLTAAAVYFVIMLGLRLKLLKINVAAVLLALIAIFEALTNFEMFVASKKADNTEFAGRLELSQMLKEIDDGNYRIKDFALFDKHNTSLISGNSFNHYTSLTNQHAAASLKRLGYTKAWFWISNVSGTVFSDSLLSHKYVVNKGEIANSYLEYVGESSAYDIYRNPYCLDMGIITQSGAFESEQTAPLKYQDELYKHITGNDLFTFYDYETNGIDVDTAGGITYFKAKTSSPVIFYDITVGERQVLYFYIDTLSSYSINIKVNGESVISNYPYNDCNGIIELGAFENESVNVQLKLKSDIKASSIELGGLALRKMDELKQYALSADSASYGGGKYVITANNVLSGSSLMLSVPYDEGFTCYVNGSKKDIKLTCEGFMLVELNEGSNLVEFVYYPKGLNLGIAAFAAGILLILFIIYLKGGIKIKPSEKICTVTENICYYAFIAVTIAAFIVMIAFPVTAFFAKVFI